MTSIRSEPATVMTSVDSSEGAFGQLILIDFIAGRSCLISAEQSYRNQLVVILPSVVIQGSTHHHHEK